MHLESLQQENDDKGKGQGEKTARDMKNREKKIYQGPIGYLSVLDYLQCKSKIAHFPPGATPCSEYNAGS